MSPRSSKQFEKIREDKIALIMEVALEHFASKGYHATTIYHIAKHAGISKGLMYNYFSGKEELLSAIIEKSLSEVYSYFDTDRDGILSPAEFEFFVRKIFYILQGKKRFWQLFFQLFIQNEAREHLLRFFPGQSNKEDTMGGFIGDPVSHRIMHLISDYFCRKSDKNSVPENYRAELNLFLLTLTGFAVTYVYSDWEDESGFIKSVEAIIERYK